MIPVDRRSGAIFGSGGEAVVARNALTMIALENRPALMRFLAARRVPPDETEDIIQDLFIKIERLPTGPVAEPRAYLYRMAENLLLDRRRAACRRARREMAWTESHSGPVMEADDRPSPERTLIARERLQRVAEALRTLPDKTAAIFRKFRIDGVPQREIAAEMGISLSAVEKRLHTAYRVVAEVQARLDLDAHGRLAQFKSVYPTLQ